MSVLVYAESSEGKFKKVALEVTSYGKTLAEQFITSNMNKYFVFIEI